MREPSSPHGDASASEHAPAVGLANLKPMRAIATKAADTWRSMTPQHRSAECDAHRHRGNHSAERAAMRAPASV
jgi:hypothetical protein